MNLIQNKDKLQGKYCAKPFDSLELHLNGEAYVCCPSWLNTSVGNLKNSDLNKIWNSEIAQSIRESILDGSYKYCNQNVCPFIQSDTLYTADDLPNSLKRDILNQRTILEKRPENIMLSYDRSCNLSCPSCRTEVLINNPSSKEYKDSEFLTNKIFDELILNLKEDKLVLNITGSGDPFSSATFKKFIEKIDGKSAPNLLIDFQTNGILLTPDMWDRISNISMNINKILVSIDAATAETYSVVRRGGSWPILIQNLKFIAQLRKDKKFNLLQARFVVQKSNFREMEKFATTFLAMGFDVAEFSMLDNWGTWTSDEYQKQCLGNSADPENEEFFNILSKRIFGNHKIMLGNLTPYQKQARKYWANKLPFFQRLIYRLENSTQNLVNYGLEQKGLPAKTIYLFLKFFHWFF